MKKWPRWLAGTSTVLCALLIAAPFALAATCTLQQKRFASGNVRYTPYAPTPDWLFRICDAQSFPLPFSTRVVVKDGKQKRIRTPNENHPALREFNRVVKKEPAKYHSKLPFRGVARFGDQRFAFAIDTPEANSQSYGLLYFDRNANGDLTDDPLIESIEVRRQRAARERAAKRKAEKTKHQKDKKEKDKQGKKKKTQEAFDLPYGRNATEFPRVDLKIEIDGKKVDYAFFCSTQSYLTEQWGYATASLRSAVYYEGEIELEGRKQRVVLGDYNCNGRFDDRTTVDTVQYGPNQPPRCYPRRGDTLFLDPKPITDMNLIWDPTGLDFRHNVEKILCLDGRYYDLKVAPAGNELTIEPSKVPLGRVKNPNENYTAVVYGNSGVIRIKGTKDQPVPLPEGEWKLLSYVINLTDVEPPKKVEKKTEAKAKNKREKGNLWAALGKAMGEAVGAGALRGPARTGPSRTTIASATALGDYKAIKVSKDKTTLLPFGPPFKTAVTPSNFDRNRDTFYLSLDITGSAGEILTNLVVNGRRPGKPKLKITDAEGNVVVKGNFEYG